MSLYSEYLKCSGVYLLCILFGICSGGTCFFPFESNDHFNEKLDKLSVVQSFPKSLNVAALRRNRACLEEGREL